MKIYATSAYPRHRALERFRELAALDRVGAHQLCERPELADTVLFVEDAQFDDYSYRRLLSHPLVAQSPERCAMYNEADQPWLALPGLYCSMPANAFDPARQRASAYLSTPNALLGGLHLESGSGQRDTLFAFVGTGCNWLRKRMIRCAREQGALIHDTSGFNVWDCGADERRAQGEVFAQAMRRCQFMLCPRGLGTASFRLFETMQSARVPVIIADQWVPPAGIDWSFAVQLPERELPRLREHLQALSGEASERGARARATWEAHFGPDRWFHRAGEQLNELRLSGSPGARPQWQRHCRHWWVVGEQGVRRALERWRGRRPLSAGELPTGAAPR